MQLNTLKEERENLITIYKRNIDTWNGLKEEVIMAKNVQQMKEKLDKYR